MKTVELFLDMDGVLCDFATAAFDACEQKFNPMTYPKGEWELSKAWGGTEKDMWQCIDDNGSPFWENLTKYPWAETLLALSNTVTILSSPYWFPSCHYGKAAWHEDNIGREIELILCKSKHLLAGPGRVLIDDNNKNCERWQAAGGYAILFPAVWNSGWRHALEPMEIVLQEWNAVCATLGVESSPADCIAKAAESAAEVLGITKPRSVTEAG